MQHLAEAQQLGDVLCLLVICLFPPPFPLLASYKSIYLYMANIYNVLCICYTYYHINIDTNTYIFINLYIYRCSAFSDNLCKVRLVDGSLENSIDTWQKVLEEDAGISEILSNYREWSLHDHREINLLVAKRHQSGSLWKKGWQRNSCSNTWPAGLFFLSNTVLKKSVGCVFPGVPPSPPVLNCLTTFIQIDSEETRICRPWSVGRSWAWEEGGRKRAFAPS